MIPRLCEFLFIHIYIVCKGKWAKSRMLKRQVDLLRRVNLEVESDLEGHEIHWKDIVPNLL